MSFLLSLTLPSSRYKTLKGIRAKQEGSEDARERQDLNRLNLYLVDWGYNTERERRDAQQDSKVELISLPAFSERLRSGFQ